MKGHPRGRHRPRAALHMTALMALGHSPARRAFLRPAAGKAEKLPLAAATGRLGAPLSPLFPGRVRWIAA